MRLLLDTHFLIWVTNAPELLRPRERVALSGDADLLVSSISLLEIRLKWRALETRGKPHNALSPAKALALIGENGLALVELASLDIAAELVPPVAHTDPFDELLLLHAQQLGAKLLTRDGRLRDHPSAYRFA
ncbi:MAG: PIN domain-containing protein [Sphingomonas sp.]|uniref:type II toxin-antitoxin system VapC family toxin n=1 Tax=Sphingomonas sp. TaxID=28214 RepID=UPI001B04B23E|nr:PIN domain-containing protein [Sphingomonas sp.]MBO9624712.1 PIN domain-containing protein [Sphingomonas sp.]